MAFSRTIGEYQGAHVLAGLGAAPFEAMVAISVADVWFAHERGSKLGGYVFGLAFGSFIGPICAGYISVNQGWRWIYRWGAILTSILLLLFYFTFEETCFVRNIHEQEGQRIVVEQGHIAPVSRPTEQAGGSEEQDDMKKANYELELQMSHGPKVGDIFEAAGFKAQYSLWKSFPRQWREINSQFWRPLKVSALPAVVWVSEHRCACRDISLILWAVWSELWHLRVLARGYGNDSRGDLRSPTVQLQ